MSIPSFTRLVRFHPPSSTSIRIGKPVKVDLDVGAATRAGEKVAVEIWSGSSILDPGHFTGETDTIGKLLSPLAEEEVGTIRCIGLNYAQHAAEASLPKPDLPVLFLKPSTSLANPYPSPTIIPRLTLLSDTCDYESELAIIIGRTCKDVSEADALSYVLGYTAANDVSSRESQFAQSQWCFSKGFDGACPIGPTMVSTEVVGDGSGLRLRGLKNGKVMQDCGVDDLIFSVPKIVSFLSQGTTLKPGTIILTGTPAGVGFGFSPKEYLRDGDEFAVEILPHIGTLITKFEAEK